MHRVTIDKKWQAPIVVIRARAAQIDDVASKLAPG